MLSQIPCHEPALAQHLALFLDIDGILHSTTASCAIDSVPPRIARERRIALVRGLTHPSAYGLLVQEKQDLLANILVKNPHVVIVISSAWRNWIGYDDTKGEPTDAHWERTNVADLLWLKALLHPVLAGRIVGKTPNIDRELNGSNAQPCRLDEIRYFMQTNGDRLNLARNWVALDDQGRHFPKEELASSYNEDEIVVLLNGERALEPHSSAELAVAINKASCAIKRVPQVHC